MLAKQWLDDIASSEAGMLAKQWLAAPGSDACSRLADDTEEGADEKEIKKAYIYIYTHTHVCVRINT